MTTRPIEYNVRTGDEFYRMINYIVSRRAKQGQLPVLADYLSSLWNLASQYKNKPPALSYSQLAKWIDEAFDTPPMKHDWRIEQTDPYFGDPPLRAVQGTPEFRQEYESYEYFDKYMSRLVYDCKRLSNSWTMPEDIRWENMDVENFLERSVAGLEGDNDTEEFYGQIWSELKGILNNGRYTE